MKVLQLITSTRSFFEQQVRVLEDRGVECTVLGVPGDYRPSAPRSIRDYARYYPQVLREARRGDYDLVHANYGLVAPFALGQPVRPVVLTLWGSELTSDYPRLRLISQVGARLADVTIIPSPVMAPALRTDRYVHIPFGVDTELFRPIPRDEARRKVDWPADGRIALFPYDPTREVKNYPLARRVAEHAGVDVELRTVVDAPYERMPYYMNASDVLLVTSAQESGPMVVREAAACNLPVVATDVGFVRETIHGLRNCFVCRTEDELVPALESVLEDGGRSDGRDTVERFSLDVMGDRLLALYEAVQDGTEFPEVLRHPEIAYGA